VKELDDLVSNLKFLTLNNFGEDTNIDLSNLTIIGHGFGASSAILFSSKDQRIKKLITYDPLLLPLKNEIMSHSMSIS
jgi:Platelet-activating factor acetylhydrolase, isoform II